MAERHQGQIVTADHLVKRDNTGDRHHTEQIGHLSIIIPIHLSKNESISEAHLQSPELRITEVSSYCIY